MPKGVINKERSWRVRDRTGERFGRLVVTEYVGVGLNRQAVWRCRCDCGEVRDVLVRSLAAGATTSCGCYARERSTTHGLYSCSKGSTSRPEFSCWRAMIQRCLDQSSPAFEQYGGVGITVCDGWLNFDVFLRDMGPRPSSDHSIDRIDNNKGYSPDNCRWATLIQQARNKKKVPLLTYQGLTMTAPEWSEKLGFARGTINDRLRRGWFVEKALSTPADTKGRK